MRTLACVGSLALFLVARGALAAAPAGNSSSPEKATDTAASDANTPAPEAASKTGSPSDRDKDKERDKNQNAKPADTTYGHGMQFGLRAGLVGGYNMEFRYDQSPYCATPKPNKSAKDQQKFCGHAAPLGVDLALSFAPLGAIEPFIWGRFGFTGDDQTDTNPLVLIGAGARIYTMSDSAFKVFIEPAIGVELEGGAGNPIWKTNKPEYKQDVIFHVAAGPQYDIAQSFGIYLDAGLTVGILRSIHTTMELNGGVQLRFP